MKVMERAAVDGLELEYELRGSGASCPAPIQWGVSATWAEPVLEEPTLADSYRLLSYHRAGFGGSSPIEGPVTMADHAEHCRLLMRQPRDRAGAHRRSFLERRDRPAARARRARGGPHRSSRWTRRGRLHRRSCKRHSARSSSSSRSSATAPATRKARSTRSSAASSAPTTATRSSRDSPAPSTRRFPTQTRSSPRSCRHSGRPWSLTEKDAKRITQPVLVVVGENSAPHLPGATRAPALLASERRALRAPRGDAPPPSAEREGMAEARASFFARHPLPTSTGPSK